MVRTLQIACGIESAAHREGCQTASLPGISPNCAVVAAQTLAILCYRVCAAMFDRSNCVRPNCNVFIERERSRGHELCDGGFELDQP